MSKLFKSHAPKPAGPAATPAGAPRVQPVPREKPGETAAAKAGATTSPKTPCGAGKTEEIGGPEGPEPTRYGDWEIKGRCIDF